jgi:hypothetical protein
MTNRERLYLRLDEIRARGERISQRYHTPEALAGIAVNSAAIEGETLSYERLLERFRQLLDDQVQLDGGANP